MNPNELPPFMWMRYWKLFQRARSFGSGMMTMEFCRPAMLNVFDGAVMVIINSS